MKIEKINDNQIRCTLTKEDLADRQIKLSELAYGSEKARGLFKDMIQQANYEFGFEANDLPLMVEAIPLSEEKLILQITKVEYPEELDTRFSRFSELDEDVLEQIGFEEENSISKKGAAEVLEESEPKQVDLGKMFEFRTLEQVARLSHVLSGFYFGPNDLYKSNKTNRFYLMLTKGEHTLEEFNKVCNVAAEYAIQKKYSPAIHAHFKEHEKLLVEVDALNVLSSTM